MPTYKKEDKLTSRTNTMPSFPLTYTREAASGASIAAKNYAPSQPLLRVHTNNLIHNKFNL